MSAPADALVAAIKPLVDDPFETKSEGKDLAVRTAAQLVQRYAPSAPEEVRREAARRCADWLYHKNTVYAERSSRSGSVGSVGESRTAYAPYQFAALRHSGAMAILSPWKVRRAGAI